MAAATEPPVTTESWAETATGLGITTPPLSVKQAGFPVGSPVGPVVGFFNWAMNFAFNGVRAWKQRGLPLWDAAETGYVPGTYLRSTDGNYYFLKVGGTATMGLAPQSDATNWTNPFAGVGTTTYTGNPVGVESPDTGPVIGGAPVLTVPTSGLIQPFKALADWSAFFSTLYNVPSAYYGDGSDGALTVSSGTTTITSPKNYSDVTVANGATLVIKNAIIRIQGTLTVGATGTVHCDGTAGGALGAGLSGFGNDTVANGAAYSLTIGGGASGSSGVPHSVSSSLTTLAGIGFSIGGSAAGGSGGLGCSSLGAGSSTSGGAGGSAGTVITPVYPDAVIYHPGFVDGRTSVGGANENIYASDSTHIIPVASLIALRGGSGGGGGAGAGAPAGGDTDSGLPTNPNGWGWTAGGPGAGGAGGGVLIIFARKISFGAADRVHAKGGNGENGTNVTTHSGQAEGGGGGGGGGRVGMFYGLNLGSFGLTSACVAGGTGGTGVNSGGTGATGATGVFQFLQLPL